MSRNGNQKEKVKDKSKIVNYITVLLLILTIATLILALVSKYTSLYIGIGGIILLMLTINISDKVIITKSNIKVWSIISIVLSIISIPLLFKFAIYSLALSAPALILSRKIFKTDSRPIINKVAYFLSIAVVLVCFIFSVLGIFTNFRGTKLKVNN